MKLIHSSGPTVSPVDKNMVQRNQMKAKCSLRSSSCAGNSLITLTFHLLNQYGLVELFQLDMVKLWRFLVMVQEDYHSDNPYHNAVHAADVTQAMYCYMREPIVSLWKETLMGLFGLKKYLEQLFVRQKCQCLSDWSICISRIVIIMLVSLSYVCSLPSL